MRRDTPKLILEAVRDQDRLQADDCYQKFQHYTNQALIQTDIPLIRASLILADSYLKKLERMYIANEGFKAGFKWALELEKREEEEVVQRVTQLLPDNVSKVVSPCVRKEA